MKIFFHKHFSKGYQKLPEKIKNQFKEKLKLFAVDSFHPILNNHALEGRFQKFRSINVNGDIRALYAVVDDDTVEFALIDSHSNLYT